MPEEPEVADSPRSRDVLQSATNKPGQSAKKESQPLLAALAVLIFWLFLSAASFNVRGLLVLSPLLLLLFVFLLVKGLVRREVRRELARI